MRKTILVVAGNRSIRDLLVQAFSDNGFRVLAAGDGGSGLLQFGLAQPDLILLDVDSCEALRRIRELSNVPVITFADIYDEEAKIRNLDSGADYCVDKPISIEELQARARALLRRDQAQRPPGHSQGFRSGQDRGETEPWISA